MGKRDKARKPTKRGEASFQVLEEKADYNKSTPRFCLSLVQRGYGVRDLDQAGQAAFARALEERATMQWSQILMGLRHGLGQEFIPASAIRPQIPDNFSDAPRFVVLRYNGNLPMIGIRTNDTFRIIWIEKKYGDVYDHGSR